MKQGLALVVMVAMCTTAHGFQQSVAFQYGTPMEAQNVPLNTYDLIYQHSVYQTSGQKLQLALEAGLGKLSTEVGDANRIAAGLSGYYHANRWVSLELAGGLLYMDEYVFVAESDRKKNFGGPRQFYGRFGGLINLASHWDAGLYLYHMSNGSRFMPTDYNYGINPAINAYSVQVRYKF